VTERLFFLGKRSLCILGTARFVLCPSRSDAKSPTHHDRPNKTQRRGRSSPQPSDTTAHDCTSEEWGKSSETFISGQKFLQETAEIKRRNSTPTSISTSSSPRLTWKARSGGKTKRGVAAVKERSASWDSLELSRNRRKPTPLDPRPASVSPPICIRAVR
jgi:hypothetical protein